MPSAAPVVHTAKVPESLKITSNHTEAHSRVSMEKARPMTGLLAMVSEIRSLSSRLRQREAAGDRDPPAFSARLFPRGRSDPDAAGSGLPDLAGIEAVMRRHGLTPAAPYAVLPDGVRIEEGLTRCGSGPDEAQAHTPATVCARETSYCATFAIFWSLMSAVR